MKAAKIKTVMLKTMLFACLFCTTALAQAQNEETYHEFAPIGAKWYYHLYLPTWPPSSNPYEHSQGYQLLEVVKDTIVAGKRLKKIVRSCEPADQEICHKSPIYIYQEGGKIYQVDITADNILHIDQFLYNFEAEVGDTWDVVPDSPGFVSVRVIAKDSIQVDGIWLKRIVTEPLPPLGSIEFSGTFTEKFGSFDGFNIGEVADPDMGKFRCYEDTDLFYQRPDEWSCDSIYLYTVGIEETLSSSINIYPNPTHDFLHIDLRKQLNLSYPINVTLYNILGQSIYQSNITQDIHFIDVTHLLNGQYWLKIANKEYIIIKT